MSFRPDCVRLVPAACAVTAGLLLGAAPAAAQTRPPAPSSQRRPPVAPAPGQGRVEVGVGVRWTGDEPFDCVSATETALSNSRYTLFHSDTALQAAFGVDGRIGVRLGQPLQLEGTFSFARPSLSTRITGDVEGAGDVTIADTITQYTAEGGITLQLARWRIGRLAPFASGGVGYLRQLYDGRQLVETGETYYVGGGVRLPLTMARRRGLVRASGVRVDVRALRTTRGVALDEGTHTVPSLSASLFVRF